MESLRLSGEAAGQLAKESAALETIFVTDVFYGMKRRDRAADAGYLVLQERCNGRRLHPHDVIYCVAECERNCQASL